MNPSRYRRADLSRSVRPIAALDHFVRPRRVAAEELLREGILRSVQTLGALKQMLGAP